MKKPLKLSINEFISGQEFDGMKQINLHNGFLDPTMMREKLLLDFFNRKGLPAPRCTFAEVYFDSSYVGLFKVVEEVDKRFLNTHFGNKDGNLYKGEPRGTLEWHGSAQWNYYKFYELKTNEDKNNWDDIMNFIDLVNHSARADFKREMDYIFNTDSYLMMWAANNLFGNLDAYFYQPHNYYLYHNTSTGKFEWITWDVGTAFGVFPFWKVENSVTLDPVFYTESANKRPLNEHLLEIDDYRDIYFRAYCDYLHNDFTKEKLFPAIDSIANRIRPFIYAEPDSNQMYPETDFEGNIGYVDIKKWWYSLPALKSFIENRHNYLVNRLCELDRSCVAGIDVAPVINEITNVFPNPADDEITVTVKYIEKETPSVDFILIDISGRVAGQYTIYPQGLSAQVIIDLKNLPGGIYLLVTEAGCRKISKKVVVF
ncbi:MAG: CotH kinase family protein [Bacteroidetes bacterium]|nr:CotH kinase family protein [Bacteroidota bacterium]